MIFSIKFCIAPQPRHKILTMIHTFFLYRRGLFRSIKGHLIFSKDQKKKFSSFFKHCQLAWIVNQQQTPSIDEEKLKIFCSRTNVWDHFGLERDVFSMVPEDKQIHLIRKFYFDHLPKSNNGVRLNLILRYCIQIFKLFSSINQPLFVRFSLLFSSFITDLIGKNTFFW